MARKMNMDKKGDVNFNKIELMWLGQSGFILNAGRTRIIIDPYLSDYCEKKANFKRITPVILKPEDVRADFIITSHLHPDHFDEDSLPVIMQNNNPILIGPQSCIQRSIEMGFKKKNLILFKEGQYKEFDEFGIKGIYSDHGDLEPFAIGFLFFIKNIKIYFSGDTSFKSEKMQKIIKEKPDIAIIPINGAYGNLDPLEAAVFARELKAETVVPCHYWTFVEHDFGSPRVFKYNMSYIYPECRVELLKMGEIFTYIKKTDNWIN